MRILSWAKNSCGVKLWSVLFMVWCKLESRMGKIGFWPKEIRLGEIKCELTHQLPAARVHALIPN